MVWEQSSYDLNPFKLIDLSSYPDYGLLINVPDALEKNAYSAVIG